MIKKDLFDTNASLYVLSCLMRNPLLLQEDKYSLVKTDFYKPLQQMIFITIYNMAQNGVEKIVPQDIDLYISQYTSQYEYYKQNKGYEFVMQCYQTAEGSDEKQFDSYYQRLKKFSMLRDLEEIGINTKQFYDTEKDALNRDLEDEKLNKTSLDEILNAVRSKIVTVENKHIGKSNNSVQNASFRMRELVQELQENPEVGLPLEGEIINYACRGARLGKLYTYSAPSGAGKALPNDTLIPMYDGSWKQVGDVRPNDILIDRYGRPTKVEKIFPQGQKQVYKITFKDGREALCNDEHLWTYHNECSGDYYKLETKTLKELMQLVDRLGYKSDKSWRFSIPIADPIQYKEQELPFDPYLLGLLLGDGSFREHSSNRNLAFSDGTGELVQNFKQLGWSICRNSQKNYTYHFKDENQNNIHVREFCQQYSLNELYNVLTEDKQIPSNYLIGSIDQRLSLLQGLLDTDGSVDVKGRINFTTINNLLAKQVQQLCWSLGLICIISQDKRTDKYSTQVCYNLHITGKPEMKKQLFRYSYKKERIEAWFNNGKKKIQNIYNPIVKIEPLNKTTEMTCFLVDNEEHLFLMNDYIVTHNTRYMVENACAISLPYIDDNNRVVFRGDSTNPDYQKVLFVTTEQQLDEIQTMILAHVSGVNEKSILFGNFTPSELERIKQALDIIDKYGSNFIIECIPDPSIALLRARLTKYIIQDGIEYIFYDYIFSSPGLLSEFRDVAVREDKQEVYVLI